MICTVCGSAANWVENKAVYGRNYGRSYMIWLCSNRRCGAYVGCHQNTEQPVGTFADKELRQARQAAHAAIDPVWKSGAMTRAEVYRRLSAVLGWDVHVGMATLDQCRSIVETAQREFEESRS
jgi:hypothetical protein